LRVLKVAQPERQLARLAALDAAVCMILSALLRPASPLSKADDIARPLRHIRFDEARHVRITRACAMALGFSRTQMVTERNVVLQAFATLLYPAAAELRCLAVDLESMLSRWKLAQNKHDIANNAVFLLEA
jgi:hypothetical protein